MKFNLNVKVGALLFGSALLVLGAGNATFGNVSGGTVCLASGILVILLFYFDVKKFNVFGLAAELRDKISEADKILETLRGISLPISEIAITTVSQAGRHDSVVPRKKLYDFVTSISEELRGMGVTDENIEKVRDSWYLATSIDMVLPIHREIRNQIDIHHSRACKKNDDINKGVIVLSEEEHKIFSQELGRIEWDRHLYNSEEAAYLTHDYKSYPSIFSGMIKDLTGIPEVVRAEMLIKINDCILDLEYLIHQKEIRRPELWFK